MLFQPGTPAPPVRWESLERSAADHGLRVVSYARPGYSGSTRFEGRSVGDAARDIAAVMDFLGADTFVTLGHSGGGPHALACAALLGERCAAAATLASVAPYDGFDRGWTSGMALENVEEFSVVIDEPDRLESYLSTQLDSLSGVTSKDVAEAFDGLVSQVDVAAITGEIAELCAGWVRRAAADGLFGWVDDDFAVVSPWGFDLDSIDVPVTVWQGREDRMVPFEHGRWLADHIPSARPRLFADEGHISLMTNRLDEIITDIVDLSG